MQKKSVFLVASFGDLLLHQRQKKSFVSLKDDFQSVLRTLESLFAFFFVCFM